MIFEYKSSYIIVIPTGNKKKNRKWVKWGGNSSPLFYSPPPFSPVSIQTLFILSIRSEEALLFLVLLIHINTHNLFIIIYNPNVTGIYIYIYDPRRSSFY